MKDAYIIYNDSKIIDTIKHSDLNEECFFHFINNLKEKRKAYSIKEEWGARLAPFIALYEDGKMLKGFYTEADNNVIDSFIKYLNEKDKN